MGKVPKKGKSGAGKAQAGSRESKGGANPPEVDIHSPEYQALTGLMGGIDEVTRFIKLNADGPQTNEILERKVDALGMSLLELAELTAQGKGLKVELLIANYNRLAALVRARLKKPTPTDIDIAFFNFPEASVDSRKPSETFGKIEGLCSRVFFEADLVKKYAQDVKSRVAAIKIGPFQTRALFVADMDEAAEIVKSKFEELEILRNRAEALLAESRTADSTRQAAILQEIESMSPVDLVHIAGASIVRVRTGVARERQRVGAEITDLFAGLPSEKQEAGRKIVARIESLVKGSKDAKLMGLLAEMEALVQGPELESETSRRVRDLLGRIEKVVPTSWADILDFDGSDVLNFIAAFEGLRREYEQLKDIAKGENKFVVLQQAFDIATGVYVFFSGKRKEKEDASAGDSSVGGGGGSGDPDPDAAGDKKKERPEMSAEQIDKLRAFIVHDFDAFPDTYGEVEFIEIAQILATARSKRMRMPNGLSQKARELFASRMFGMSPENALKQHKEFVGESELREKRRAARVVADQALKFAIDISVLFKKGITEDEKKELRAKIKELAQLRKDDDVNLTLAKATELSSFAGALRERYSQKSPEADEAPEDGEPSGDDEPPEDDEVDDDDMDADLGGDGSGPEAGPDAEAETGTEEQRERRGRVDAILAELSAQDFWRDDVVGLPEDERSLFAFGSDAVRRNYVRTQLFLGGEEEGIFFDRLVVQSRNPDEARRILRAILAEIKDLSVEQRREIFAEETVTVEAEWGEDEGPEAPDKKDAPGPDAPPLPEPPKGSPPPEPEPVPSLEPGPIPPPDAEAGKGRKGSREAEKETVWARMRGWTKQKFGELEDLDVYRVHMKGEKTRAEMDGSSATLSRPAMITGAIFSAALSYLGGALFADLPRYIGQRYYTRVERDEISTAFKAALEERRKRESGAPESAGVIERSDALRKRVFASRYLTNAQKQELLIKLQGEEDSFAGITSPYNEHLNREVGRILENAIRTRVSEEKVLKEAMNTLFVVSGAQFLRAPTYGAISLYERWSRLTRETPESKAGDRLRATVSGGFSEYWDQAKGKNGRLAQAAAFGTAARFVGMSATLVESAVASGFVGDLLYAWEGKEAAYPADASDLSHQNIDEISERVRQAATESSRVETPDVPAGGGRVEIPEPNLRIFPGESFDTGESGLNESIDNDFESVPGGDSDATSLPEESSFDGESLPEVVPEAEVIMSPDRIPQEALVTQGDGITQSLLSAVEARPELLGAAERGVLSDDYTAALLMRRMAAKDGLLNYWISEKAIGELAIVPVYDTEGIPHIAFLNPETGTAYSVEELKSLGWLIKAPK